MEGPLYRLLISFWSINKHGRYRQFLFLIGLFKKKEAFSLKPLCQMNRNLVGSIYVRSSINNVHFVLIRLQAWSPQTTLVSDWLIFSSPDSKGHVSYCHHFSSVVRLSVNISHFNFLLRNYWANCNQALLEWFLDGPLPKLCPVMPFLHEINFFKYFSSYI